MKPIVGVVEGVKMKRTAHFACLRASFLGVLAIALLILIIAFIGAVAIAAR